jgi:subtilisin family serine protease
MRTVLTTLLLAFLLTSTAEAQPGPPDQARPIEGVILMKFAPDALEAPPQQLRANDLNLQGRQAARLRQLLNARRGPGQKLFRNFTPADTLGRHRQTGEPVRLKDLSRWYRFPVRDTTDVGALAARLQELPVVLKATPDYEAFPASFPPESGPALARTEPNDPLYSQQWGYDDFDDTDVDAPEAWSLNTGRSDVTVAVVDGGVDLDHPDLDPGDQSRVIQGYDFGDDDSDPDDDRSSGAWTDHGTPVAGTIGARTDNGDGVAD